MGPQICRLSCGHPGWYLWQLYVARRSRPRPPAVLPSHRIVDIVSRAAQLTGVPHQTYLKAVTIRGALQELKLARDAGVNVPAEGLIRTGTAADDGRTRAAEGALQADTS
jgi:hypothetical protein